MTELNFAFLSYYYHSNNNYNVQLREIRMFISMKTGVFNYF